MASTIISQAETMIGGYSQRRMWGFFLIAVGLTLSFVKVSAQTPLILQLTGMVRTLSAWLLLWDHSFPGSAVYRDDASFLDRNAALMTFLGCIATIVFTLLAERRTSRQRVLKAR